MFLGWKTTKDAAWHVKINVYGRNALNLAKAQNGSYGQIFVKKVERDQRLKLNEFKAQVVVSKTDAKHTGDLKMNQMATFDFHWVDWDGTFLQPIKFLFFLLQNIRDFLDHMFWKINWLTKVHFLQNKALMSASNAVFVKLD